MPLAVCALRVWVCWCPRVCVWRSSPWGHFLVLPISGGCPTALAKGLVPSSMCTNLRGLPLRHDTAVLPCLGCALVFAGCSWPSLQSTLAGHGSIKAAAARWLRKHSVCICASAAGALQPLALPAWLAGVKESCLVAHKVIPEGPLPSGVLQLLLRLVWCGGTCQHLGLQPQLRVPSVRLSSLCVKGRLPGWR